MTWDHYQNRGDDELDNENHAFMKLLLPIMLLIFGLLLCCLLPVERYILWCMSCGKPNAAPKKRIENGLILKTIMSCEEINSNDDNTSLPARNCQDEPSSDLIRKSTRGRIMANLSYFLQKVRPRQLRNSELDLGQGTSTHRTSTNECEICENNEENLVIPQIVRSTSLTTSSFLHNHSSDDIEKQSENMAPRCKSNNLSISNDHAYSFQCQICLDDLKPGDTIAISKKLLCKNHFFHEACIKLWLKRHNTCPCCRGIYVRVDNSSRGRKPRDLLQDAKKECREIMSENCKFCATHGLIINDCREDTNMEDSSTEWFDCE